MKRLVEFPLKDGSGSVVVEIDEPRAESGLERASRSGEIAEKATKTFEEALSQIRPVATAVIQELRSIAETPDEIGVEFGFTLTAKAGAVVASAEAEANFKVSLSWKK